MSPNTAWVQLSSLSDETSQWSATSERDHGSACYNSLCTHMGPWASRILFGRGENSLDSPGGKVNGQFFRLPCNILRLTMVAPLGGADHISISVNLTTLSPSPTSRIHPLYQGTRVMLPGFTGRPISISVEPNSSWSTIVFGSAY